MLTKTTRVFALCAALLLALPAMAQGTKPNPTPATSKGNTQSPTSPTQQGGEIRQWASLALASSEYSSTGWSAMQATGAPDSAGCQDQETAFATLDATDGEYLIVAFDQKVIPTQINVHITLNPGSITKLSVADSTRDNSIIDVTNSGDAGSTRCPGIHTINITGATVAMDSVIISLDQARSGTWTEIDAVELVGYAEGTTPPVSPTQSNPTGPTVRNTPTPQPPSTISGVAVTCPDGTTFNNGVEVLVNMRPGFTYTATAIGIGSFDPIIAVIDADDGSSLCNDDDRTGASYVANLPTTGSIGPSNLTAHIPFSYTSNNAFGNVRVVVGSVGSTAGEFLLLVEGLVVTRNDGSTETAGDPFVVLATSNVVASGVPYTVYMISVTDALDPMITILDDENEGVIRLNDGTLLACDDAGNASLCFGNSVALTGFNVSRQNGRTLPGGRLDSMLSIPADVFTVQDGGLLNLRFTSSGQNSLGDYVAAFHLGTVAGRR